MVIREVKRALKDRGRMTLSQLSAETGNDRVAVTEALQFFVRRGEVFREVESGTGVTCGTTCRNCPIGDTCVLAAGDSTGLEVFVWTGGR